VTVLERDAIRLFGAALRPTSLKISEQLEIPKWKALLEALAAMERGRQWWIGDALVYGEATFEEELFVQHSSEVGLEPGTLVNYRWIASSIDPSRRREELSFSHHAEVARLKPDEQDAMLERAIANGWTVRELRTIVAIELPEGQVSLLDRDDDRDPPASVEEAVQRRLERISLAFQSDGLEGVTAEDLAWLLELAKQLTRTGRYGS
jgi:hypothetical protein